MMMGVILIGVLVVAYANGANANMKGMASVYGSGTLDLRRAIMWAAAATALGCMASILWGHGILKIFSGRGLVADEALRSGEFLGSVALGAGMSNLLATRMGFPVSTSHMLIGALVGGGMATGGMDSIQGAALWKNFVRPLLLSPVIAIGMGLAVNGLFRLTDRIHGPWNERILDRVHLASGSAVCFSRGLNDAPKIAGLLQSLSWPGGLGSLVCVGVLMAVGGLTGARRVAGTLGHKITGMDSREGFAANLATALLVLTASWHGMPVSTTHVSVGALIGIGVSTSKARWKTIIPVVMAWIITLPAAALCTACVYFLFKQFK